MSWNDILLTKNQLELSALKSIVQTAESNDLMLRAMSEKFMEAHPNIPPENVYIDDRSMIHLVGSYTYWDDTKGIVLHLPYFFGTDSDGNYNVASFEGPSKVDIIAYAEEQLANNNWSELVALCPEYFQIEYFSRYWDRMPVDMVYSSFVDIYTKNDYGVRHISLDTVKQIYGMKTNADRKATSERMTDLPEVITIYRGVGDGSTDLSVAFSWTTDINVAVFFAAKNANRYAKVYSGKIRKSDIMEFITDRNESEVFVCPDSVIDPVEVISMPSSREIIERFPLMSVYQDYRLELNRLLQRQGRVSKDGAHDGTHMLRVLLYALIIASEYPDIYEDETALEQLCVACISHDIGRDNDDEDDNHGEVSVRVLEEECYFDVTDELEFLIKYHCLDDDKAARTRFRKDPVIWLMYQILKDADALDRVRFGIRGLDVTMLRCPVSSSLILFAVQAQNGLAL